MLSNLGGEHKEIEDYLGLADFKIKFSRSREEIFRSESQNLKIKTTFQRILILLNLFYQNQLENLKVLNVLGYLISIKASLTKKILTVWRKKQINVFI